MKRGGRLNRYTELKAKKTWIKTWKPKPFLPFLVTDPTEPTVAPYSEWKGSKRIKGLAARSKSKTALLKQEIQDLVRLIVMARDGGCVLRNVKGIPGCNGYRKDGQLILQADHLITRSNGATYADTRLIVCVCKGHHGWKSVGANLNKEQYDTVVRTVLPKDRVELWDKCKADSWRPVPTRTYDLKMSVIYLKQELKTYESENTA